MLIITMASLAIPLISPMDVGRSGFAGSAALALLGYTIYPAVRMFRGYILASGVSGGVSGLGLGWGYKSRDQDGEIHLPQNHSSTEITTDSKNRI